ASGLRCERQTGCSRQGPRGLEGATMRRLASAAVAVTNSTDAHQTGEANEMTTSRPRRFALRSALPALVATATALVLLPSLPAGGAVDCEAVRCSLQSQFDSLMSL